ncbi:MAG: hypothetical protein ACJ74W_20850 [Pyrinomonadaceae bacterium]
MPTRRPHLTRALLIPLFALLPVTAPAQQPFVTDDADVTPRGHFHFEFSNEFDVLQRALAPSRFQNTADAELDYGLWPGVEIGIEAPLLTIFNARGAQLHRPTGLGDTNFSIKYNFHKEREGSGLPAMAVTFNLETPTGSVRKQLGSGLADYYLNGVLQKSVSTKTKLRLNGGILFAGNTTTGVIGINTRGTVLTGGASLVKQFTNRFTFGAELTGALTRNFALSKGQLQGLVGGNYALRKNLTLDFGLVGGRFSASPRAGAQLGFSLDF